MTNLADRIGKWIQWALPSPFTIAILLTVATFVLAFLFTEASSASVFYAWENGLWNPSLLAFAVQMMLILVLGHCLALSPPIHALISKLTQIPKSTAEAAALVAFCTLSLSLFNWGLGLIFGAVFARKTGEALEAKNIKFNYPLIGAAGYAGFMVWHGGISGSATTKVAESGHLASLMQGSKGFLEKIPDSISFSETVFSSMNLMGSLGILILLPALFFLIGKRIKPELETNLALKKENQNASIQIQGLDRLDHLGLFSKLIGGIIILYFLWVGYERYIQDGFRFINPNYLNGMFLGLCLILHKSIHGFLNGIQDAISGASGILIQFPLYFGIMGIMKSTGMIQEVSDFFVSISNQTTYPIFTLISAGLVNVFVPSGGGQWAVQGPIIVSSSLALDVSLPKAIMALCYGDQLTNMLQPFWALPLLGITGLKAKKILPFTLLMMMAGFIWYILILLMY